MISVKSDSLAGMIELIFFVAIAARGETPSTPTLFAFQTEFLRREHMAAKESTCSRLSLPVTGIACRQAFLFGLDYTSCIFWFLFCVVEMVRESSI